jgi:hypothetical protein
MDFNSDQDLYSFILSIISIATDLGDGHTAKDLTGSMVSFPISERFDELRDALLKLSKRLGKDGYSYPPNLVNDVEDAIKAIEKAFKRANSPFG